MLSQVSQATGVPVARLVELNALPNPTVIEVDQVLKLDPAPEPAPAPRVAVAPASSREDPLREWARDRWESLPLSDLSRSAVWQGALTTAVLLVGGMLLVLLGYGRGPERTASRSLFRFVGLGEPALATAGAIAVPASGRPIEPGPQEQVRIPEAAAPEESPRINVAEVARASSERMRPALEAFGRVGLRVLATPVAALRFAGWLRRGQAERERRESLERWWRQGAEALRAGLLDEAEGHFRAGLKEAEHRSWEHERTLYMQSLDEVASIARSSAHQRL
jgi:hypothetical protein